MKKLLIFLLTVTMIISVAGCGSIDPESKRYAMITDTSGAEGSTEAESVWEGVQAYADVLPCVATMYTPEKNTLKEYKSQIKTAVKDGAKVVVAYGEDMSVPVYNGQKDHKKTKFILVDALPISESDYSMLHPEDTESINANTAGSTDEGGDANANTGSSLAESQIESTAESTVATASTDEKAKVVLAGAGLVATGNSDVPAEILDATDSTDSTVSVDPGTSPEDSMVTSEGAEGLISSQDAQEETSDTGDIAENTCVVKISETDAGFLAGYAAVAEGFTNLGFLGGEKNEKNNAFGNGFIKGAEAAAAERAMGEGSITVTYGFAGTDELSPMEMSTAMSWYGNGVQLIFTSNAKIGQAVAKAAETTESGKVMTVGVTDELGLSERMIMTAIPDYKQATYNAIASFEGGTFPGGTIVKYGIKDSCVTISTDLSRFASFTENTFQVLKDNIKNNKITITEDDMTGGGSYVTVNKV